VLTVEYKLNLVAPAEGDRLVAEGSARDRVDAAEERLVREPLRWFSRETPP
jgi:hypothetical protein